MITHRIFLLAAPLLAVALSGPALAGNESRSAEEALIDAVRDGDADEVAGLLDRHTDPDAALSDGRFEGKTALMWAAEAGDMTILGQLIEAGADVDGLNPKGGTALMYAAVNGHQDAVRALVDAGADPNHTVRHGWTPVLLAAAKSHDDTVTALVELGADHDPRDVYGWTPLMRAAERGDRGMVRTLLELGADVHAEDNTGNTARNIARRSGHHDILDLLRRAEDDERSG